jgi:Mg2+ and Co2+ transporter CorA
MKLLGNLAAVVFLALGAIWTLQGANVIGGSFMTGQSQWLYIGLACLVAALAVLWWLNLRRPAGR